MRIGFNARLLHDPTLRGWNRYASNLLAAMTERGVSVVLYAEAAPHPDHLARLPRDSYVVRLSPRLQHAAWEHAWLPLQWIKDGIEVYHTPFHFDVPLLHPRPAVMTLHDAVEQRYYAPRASLTERFGRRGIAAALGQWTARSAADLVITVSEHARRDICTHLGIPAAKVRVIPEAHDPRFETEPSEAERAELRRRLCVEGPFALYVGSLEPRKNIGFLVQAFAASKQPMQLVLIGGEASERGEIQALAARLGMGKRLTAIGWLEDRLLPAAYAEATCFVYPSLYEGFGLQLCEAMRQGCVVLAADATSLPEVLGDGGLTFPLDEGSALSRLLERVATDAKLRVDLSMAARRRSAAFSWRRTAELTIEAYRDACRA